MSTETFYIYEIFNIVTQKRYIGMTQSIQRRCMAHLADIRARRHTAEGIVADYIKYGEESFQFKVIDLLVQKTRPKLKKGSICVSLIHTILILVITVEIIGF